MVVTVSEKLPGTILYLSKEDNNLKIFKKFYEVFDLNFESIYSRYYNDFLEIFSNKINKGHIIDFMRDDVFYQFIYCPNEFQKRYYDKPAESSLFLTGFIHKKNKKIKDYSFEKFDFCKSIGCINFPNIQEKVEFGEDKDISLENIIDYLKQKNLLNNFTDYISFNRKKLIVKKSNNKSFNLSNEIVLPHYEEFINQDIYSIIVNDVVSFLNMFITTVEFKDINQYIEDLFLLFMNLQDYRYLDLKIQINDYFKENIFLVNLDNIRKQFIKENILENNNNITNDQIFKIFLIITMKPINKVGGFLKRILTQENFDKYLKIKYFLEKKLINK